jgi:hypothetical protein
MKTQQNRSKHIVIIMQQGQRITPSLHRSVMKQSRSVLIARVDISISVREQDFHFIVFTGSE